MPQGETPGVRRSCIYINLFLCPRRAAYSNRTVRLSVRPSVCPSVRLSVRPHFCVRSVTLSFFDGFWNYLAIMFATILRRVTRKIQVRSSKVKVTLRGQRSEKGSNFRVRSVTLSFVDGFRNYLAEMFATILRRVARNIQVRSSKVKVTLRGQRSEKGSNFRVRFVTLSFFGGFRNHMAEMFATILQRVASKILVRRSKVKVTLSGQRSEKGSNFRVRSVTLSFFGRFQNYLAEMFATILRRVARKI